MENIFKNKLYGLIMDNEFSMCINPFFYNFIFSDLIWVATIYFSTISNYDFNSLKTKEAVCWWIWVHI
jgi:hypothetical protein